MRQTRPLLARSAPAFFFLLMVVFVAGALVLALARRHQDRLHSATGPAKWIWVNREVSEEPRPLYFFAARDFDWSSPAVSPARALVFVDRRYDFFFNGAPVGGGGQKPGDPLDVYDLSSLLRRGRNRIVIRAESPNGAGGVLFLLTLPDGEKMASDATWRVAASEAELESSAQPAAVWGKPPMYPWGYPALRPGVEDSKLKTKSSCLGNLES